MLTSKHRRRSCGKWHSQVRKNSTPHFQRNETKRIPMVGAYMNSLSDWGEGVLVLFVVAAPVVFGVVVEVTEVVVVVKW